MDLVLLSTLCALAADFVKARTERGEAASAEAFREWLADEAFPALLARADQTLSSVVSMKATQHEQMMQVLSQLQAIAKAVVPPTASDRWAELSTMDRRLLTSMFDDITNDGDGDLKSDDFPSNSPDYPEVKRSLRHLKERGWIRVSEYSGGWQASPKADGMVFTWQAIKPQEFHDAYGNLIHVLPLGDGERLGAIAEMSGLPLPLATVIVEHLAGQGHLELEDGSWPPATWLVYEVTESFARTNGIQEGN